MKHLKQCLACDFIQWKYKHANCVWEMNSMNYRPTVGIETTKKFSVLSIMENI